MRVRYSSRSRDYAIILPRHSTSPLRVRPFFPRIGRPGGAGRRVPRGSRWSPSTRPGARNRGSSPRLEGRANSTRARRRLWMEDSRWTTTRTAPRAGAPALPAAPRARSTRSSTARTSRRYPPRSAPRSRPRRPAPSASAAKPPGTSAAASPPPPRPRRGPRVGRRSAPPARGSRASTARAPSRAPKRRRSSGRATTPPRIAPRRRSCRVPPAERARRAPRVPRRSREPPAKTIATVTTPLPPLPPLRVCRRTAPRSRRSRRPRGRRDRPTPPPPGTPPTFRFSSAHLRSRASAGLRAGLARTSGRRRSIARFDTDSTRGVGTTRWRRPRRSAPGGAEAGTPPRSSPRGRRGFGRRARRRTRWRRSERPGREGPERAAKNPTKTTRPGRERRATGRRGIVLVSPS